MFKSFEIQKELFNKLFSRIDGIAKAKSNPTTKDAFEDALKLIK